MKGRLFAYLVVAAIVYRGVVEQVGPLDFRPSEQVTGVRIQAGEGFGKIAPEGITWDGESYVNAALGKSPVTLEIMLESGMGKVSITPSAGSS